MGNAAYCTWVYWGINKEGRCGANEVMEGEIKSSGVVYQYCTRTKGVVRKVWRRLLTKFLCGWQPRIHQTFPCPLRQSSQGAWTGNIDKEIQYYPTACSPEFPL